MTEMPKSTLPRLASDDYGRKLLSHENVQRTGYTFSKAAIHSAFNDLECNHMETMMCAEVLQIRQCDDQLKAIDAEMAANDQLLSENIQ